MMIKSQLSEDYCYSDICLIDTSEKEDEQCNVVTQNHISLSARRPIPAANLWIVKPLKQ